MPPTPSPRRIVPAADAQMAIEKPEPIYIIHELAGIARLKAQRIAAK